MITTPEVKPSIIKSQCRSCERWLDNLDLIFGSCAYCLEERANNAIWGFRPISAREQFPRCYECNREIYLIGMKTWDRLGKSFKLLCMKCGELQVKSDRQYSQTPWGYDQKLK